jgi:carbamoyltransferase
LNISVFLPPEKRNLNRGKQMFLLKQATHRMLLQYDEKVGHIFVPNQKARLTNEKTGYYVVSNSQGFRSDFDFKDAKILMFGDSYTAGDNCDNRDRFSDKLASILGAEVYNYGVSGTGTDQHLLIYREYAKNVEADMAVICVQVDSIKRIQVSCRESIDRVTGKRVLVPKPFPFGKRRTGASQCAGSQGAPRGRQRCG